MNINKVTLISGVMILFLLFFGFGNRKGNDKVSQSKNHAEYSAKNASIPSKVVRIPEGVYTYTDEKDFFYPILHSDSPRKAVFTVSLKGCPASERFITALENEFANSSLSSYYDLEVKNVVMGRKYMVSFPELTCTTKKECEKEIALYQQKGELWFQERCSSLCIIDTHNNILITPESSSQDPQLAIDFLHAHAFH